MVVNGLKGTVERAQESEKLLLYGFLNFANITVAKAGEVLDKVRVWRGEKKFIDIAPSQDIIVTLPKTEIAKYKMTLNYATPQIAPIKAGQNIATLTVTAPSITPQIFNIHAKENNHAVSAFKRVIENITYYLFGLKD
jgi:D-alanyl-D-alanine carboxypeptidase (penicillin-binding protein 5/6)